MLENRAFPLLALFMLFGCGPVDENCTAPEDLYSGTYELTSFKVREGEFPHGKEGTKGFTMVVDKESGTVEITYMRDTSTVVEKWNM